MNVNVCNVSEVFLGKNVLLRVLSLDLSLHVLRFGQLALVSKRLFLCYVTEGLLLTYLNVNKIG